MEKEEIKKLAHDILLDLSDKEAEDIAAEFEKLGKMLRVFEEIDTEGLRALVYPFDNETEYLREDVPERPLSKDEVLANAGKITEDCVSVPRVLK